MLKIHKFIIGIQPAGRMFRIPSIGGVVVDAILAIRSKSSLSDDYYTEITTRPDGLNFQLHNPDNGNILRIDRDQVVFIKDTFGDNSEINLRSSLREFGDIWKALDPIVNMRGIRRIGIASEQLLQLDNVNKTLLKTLTRLNVPLHPGKFHIRYEDRWPTRESIAPDIKKDDFINVITEIYDSSLDADHPESGSANINIDVQRYFQPLLEKLSDSDIDRHLKIFEEARKNLMKRLSDLELMPRD